MPGQGGMRFAPVRVLSEQAGAKRAQAAKLQLAVDARADSVGHSVCQLRSAFAGDFGEFEPAFARNIGEHVSLLCGSVQAMAQLIDGAVRDYGIRDGGKRSRNRIGRSSRCAAAPPRERRFALCVDRRDDQATEQAEAGQEILAFLGLAMRIRLVPERVRAQVRSRERAGQRERGESRCLACGEEGATTDLEIGRASCRERVSYHV